MSEYLMYGSKRVAVKVTKRELAHALGEVIYGLLRERIDDAGCDWLTDGNDVYIGGRDWFVCDRADVARLVDAINVLNFGETMHPHPAEAETGE